MTFATIGSFKGAPGVSTSTVLLAAELARRATGQKRVLIAECDPSGGDLAPRFELRSVPGIATLALLGRRGVTTPLLAESSQPLEGHPGVDLLAGVAGPEQGHALAWVVRDLGIILSAPDRVALADIGRLRHGDEATQALAGAAAVNLVIARTDAASVLHLRAGAEMARRSGIDVELLACGFRPHTPEQAADAARVPLFGWIPDDADAIAARRPFADTTGGGLPTPSGPSVAARGSQRSWRRRLSALQAQLDELAEALEARLALAGTRVAPPGRRSA
jgi:hypothetical protein